MTVKFYCSSCGERLENREQARQNTLEVSRMNVDGSNHQTVCHYCEPCARSFLQEFTDEEVQKQ